MKRTAKRTPVQVLSTVRDHLTIALRDLERGDTDSAVAELEKGAAALRDANDSPESSES